MQDQTQQPNMSLEQANEAKALLGIATRISEGLMPKAPGTPETAPGSEETLDLEEEPEKEESSALEAKFDEFKEEIKILIKEGFENLKNDEPKENGETE
mgnify:CR=1 FL=1